MILEKKDALGRDIGANHIVLTDIDFERRLRIFDPNLRLIFNKSKERWVILEKRLDGMYNTVFALEDRDGNSMPPGEWVLNKLLVFKHNADMIRGDPNGFWKDWDYYKEHRDAVSERSIRDDSIHRIVDDILTWRKAIRKAQGLPVGDVTAGYRKVGSKYG